MNRIRISALTICIALIICVFNLHCLSQDKPIRNNITTPDCQMQVFSSNLSLNFRKLKDFLGIMDVDKIPIKVIMKPNEKSQRGFVYDTLRGNQTVQPHPRL